MVRLLEPKAMTKKGMTACWIFVLMLLAVGTLSTFGLIGVVLSNFTMGFLFLIGSILMILESVFEGKKFNLSNITDRPMDSIGLFLGILSGLMAIGTFMEVQMILSVLQGISGYLLLFLTAMLMIEGLYNRT